MSKDVGIQFLWKCHPKAEKIVTGILNQAVRRNSTLLHLKKELDIKTSTRLFDWVDHVATTHSKKLHQDLITSGYHLQINSPKYQMYTHIGAQLPKVVLSKREKRKTSVAVTVDSISDFLMVRGIYRKINGSFYSPFRSALISSEGGVDFYVIERRGSIGIEPVEITDKNLKNVLTAYEKCQCRTRDAGSYKEEDRAIAEAYTLAKEIVASVGEGMAAHIILDVERKYWQSRNLAGQIQKSRQDSVGMGWANHDHHTFRSSRRHFRSLVNLFELLGFSCRERFYAGREAGWGAQVMEHTKERFVLFLDVDLTEDEIAIDFAHQNLKDLEHLGTIGLWCALHGESILQGGMHHLEAQFSFDQLTQDLKSKGVVMMAPFSNFPHLKQAFTQGEMWPVSKERIKALLKSKLITQKQATHFQRVGALGSHLENLQRKQGFKGFNQKNVSSIIRKTDPRGA